MMKLPFVAAALALAIPVFAADSAPQPPAQDKKACRHQTHHSCKAKGAKSGKPATRTFREEHSHLTTAPMVPSPPPPAG